MKNNSTHWPIKYISNLFLAALAGSSLLACTERMDITTDNAEPRLVITGYLTTDTTTHSVTVARTTGYFGYEQPKTYSAATVTINNILLTPVGNGRFNTASDFFGVGGQSYTLDVWVDFDEDGDPEHYTASTTMPIVQPLDSISLLSMQMGSTKSPWLIMMHFQDMPGPNFFGANLYINHTLYSNLLTRYYLNHFGENVADGQYIRFPAISYVIRDEMRWDNDTDFLVNPGDTVTLELNLLSEEYYYFVRIAQVEMNGGNPLFAGPPANVPGNISGGALGIFGSYTTSRKKLILPPKEQW